MMNNSQYDSNKTCSKEIDTFSVYKEAHWNQCSRKVCYTEFLHAFLATVVSFEKELLVIFHPNASIKQLSLK